jgi:hypothetical protein
MRGGILAGLLVAGVLVSGCGGGGDAAGGAPGSPGNPLTVEATPERGATAARSNEGQGAATAGQPGYEQLVDAQRRKPRSRFTPCNLVTQAQARAIFGAPVKAPVEAPQGPTCVYRTATGDGFVAIAVQSLDFRDVKPLLRQRRAVDAAGRTAFCGQYGQPMLYVPLARDRVLSVAGPCAQAKRFAARAVRELTA